MRCQRNTPNGTRTGIEIKKVFDNAEVKRHVGRQAEERRRESADAETLRSKHDTDVQTFLYGPLSGWIEFKA